MSGKVDWIDSRKQTGLIGNYLLFVQFPMQDGQCKCQPVMSIFV